MKRNLWAVALAFCLFASRALAAPVGMICNLKGEALVNGDVARNLKNLSDGDKIECKTGGEVTVVIFGNGERFVVSQQGTIRNGTVQGGRSVGGLKGPSAEAVRTLGGARVGATLSRDPMPSRRIFGKDPDWADARTLEVAWVAVPRAVKYTFSLYDDHDNALCTQTTGAPHAVLMPPFPLKPKHAYVWRVAAYDANGRTIHSTDNTIPEVRWGTLAILSTDQIQAFKQQEKHLKEQFESGAKDPSDQGLQLAVLADFYRSYGMHLRALESLEDAGADPAHGSPVLDEIGNIGHAFYLGSKIFEASQEK